MAGSDGAELLWAWLARAGLAACCLLCWMLAARCAPLAPIAWPAAAALLPLTLAALVGPGLSGAAEPLCAALLLGAALARSEQRPALAIALLAAAALLRPEALVLLAAAVAWDARPADDQRLPRRRPRRRGHAPASASPPPRREEPTLALSGAAATRALGALGAIFMVLASYGALQWAGTGTLRGAADRATALREGQPGLADRPLLATLIEALLATPWLALALPIVLVAAARWRPQRAASPTALPAAPRARRLPAELAAAGCTWLLTVAVMAELGFSGEARYLAPGVLLLAVGAVGAAAAGTPRAVGTPRVPAAAGAALLLVIAGAATTIAPVSREAAERRAAATDLERLLISTEVQRALPDCRIVAVPRYARPAVAWQLKRPIGSLQSPRLDGADCTLQRPPMPGDGSAGPASDPGPGAELRRRVATAGQWSFWTAASQPDP